MARLLLLNFLLLFFSLAIAATVSPESSEEAVARIVTFSGTVLYRDANSFYWEEVHPDTVFGDYDEIETDKDSSCEIIFKEGHVVRIDRNSKLTLQSAKKGKNKGLWQHLKISVGKIWVKLVKGTDQKDQLFIETPYVSISSKEKNVLFSISAPQGKISAYDGNLEVMSGKKKVLIAQGFESDVSSGGEVTPTQPLSNDTLDEFAKFSATITGVNREELQKLLSRLRSQKVVTVRVVSDNADIPPPVKKKSWLDTWMNIIKSPSPPTK